MANQRRPRGEDPNRESRTSIPGVSMPAAPRAPRPGKPTGGAPSLNPDAFHTKVVGPGGKNPLPAVSPPATVGQAWYNPPPIKNMPWQQNPATQPNNVSMVTPSKWNLADIARNESGFVQEFKSLLWERYQSTPEAERGSVFWQGVKQNPELAAASFARRAIQNMADANSWINGDAPPTMDRALASTSANNEVRQWLDWVRGTRGISRPAGK